jgi:HK97 gp10 family phage protein
MSEFIKITGLEELNRRLNAIPGEIATKVLRKGVAAGANLVKIAAAAEAPFITGTLRRAAIVKFLRAESNATQVEYIVTFRKGKRERKKGRDAYYASWVEFGHAGRGGKRVPPHRFLKPAFDLNYHQALAIELSTMRNELAKLPAFQA